ncbi:MAG: GlmU family protein [Bacteroidales bacterium]
MNYILFDNFRRNYLFPLTFMRPACDIRVGILTIREKWERYLDTTTSTLTEPYLGDKYPIRKEAENILINGSILPTMELAGQVASLRPRQALIQDNTIVAIHVSEEELLGSADQLEKEKDGVEEIPTGSPFLKINHPYDVFRLNDQAIREDFAVLAHNRSSAGISSDNRITGDALFVEEGAHVAHATINTSTGPVYIGRDAVIMEGSLIRGPFALGEQAVIKMGAKIYGGTTIGPYSKVGGEVNNSVFFSYSNKAHDGFLGNSVITEWCNLGADTNNSNLKNNYEPVRLWSYPDQTFVETGLQFCGLIMGDHSKCGINTMFNTGSVVGISSNIFGPGFQRNFIPSFSWGGTHGFSLFKLDKAIAVAERVYKRRGKVFDELEKNILKNVFDLTISNITM